MGQGLQNLQHGDVLEKLKMQVRDMKVGLMDSDFQIHAGYGGSIQSGYGAGQNLSQSAANGYPFQSPSQGNTKDGKIPGSTSSLGYSSDGNSLTANPASNSSTSSEGSNSSQQNNGWSFEEQFKQVRQVSAKTMISSSSLSSNASHAAASFSLIYDFAFVPVA